MSIRWHRSLHTNELLATRAARLSRSQMALRKWPLSLSLTASLGALAQGLTSQSEFGIASRDDIPQSSPPTSSNQY